MTTKNLESKNREIGCGWVGGSNLTFKRSDIIDVCSPMVASWAFGFIDSVFLLLENSVSL